MTEEEWHTEAMQLHNLAAAYWHDYRVVKQCGWQSQYAAAEAEALRMSDALAAHLRSRPDTPVLFWCQECGMRFMITRNKRGIEVLAKGKAAQALFDAMTKNMQMPARPAEAGSRQGADMTPEEVGQAHMAYVAADPAQPGAAWAVIVDDQKYVKDTAKEIANWVRKGAHVMRVDIDTAREMIMKWERPGKKAKPETEAQASLDCSATGGEP